MTKCVDTKIVANSKVYTLIKGGCFDSIEPNREKLMIDFIIRTADAKTKLTTANIPKILEYGILPKEYDAYSLLYQFRKIVFAKNNLVESINKSTGLYEIPSNVLDYYNSNYHVVFKDAFEVSSNGLSCLNNKLFDKIYKTTIEPLTQWLTTQDAVDAFNNKTRQLVWEKNCSGTKEKWEMESVCFYTNKHELDLIPIARDYDVRNFCDLPKEPVIVSTKKWRGRDIHEYRVDIIVGTVVEKNKNKAMITITTPNGDVVDIKLDKGRFSYYDRATDNDASWLTRGNKLMIIGYRRGETFYPKVYRNNYYQHSILRIEGVNPITGKVVLKSEKDSVDTLDI